MGGPEDERAADSRESAAPSRGVAPDGAADAMPEGRRSVESELNGPDSAAAGSVPTNTGGEEVNVSGGSVNTPGGDGDASAEDMSAFEAQIEDSELAKALAKIDELEDKLARAHADLYNLNQEYSNYVRRAKEAAPTHRDSGQTEVIEALIGVLDDIDAARTHGDLDDGPFAAIALKLESTLRTRFALERYGASGDAFDPAVHEALLANTNPEVDQPCVAQVLQPGYRRGERVIRAAKVMVDNPE